LPLRARTPRVDLALPQRHALGAARASGRARVTVAQRDGDGIEYLLLRHVLADGEVTTVYAVRHPLGATAVRVVHFPQPEHLDVWCRANGVDEAVVGGFFLRDPYRPLGEVWLDGRAVEHEEVAAPFGARRACVVSRPD